MLSGITVRTLRQIKKEGSINQGMWNTPGKKRQVPTIRNLFTELGESIGFSVCCETLRQILHRNGYEFKKKNHNERILLIEKYEIAAWRHIYIRSIMKKREQGMTIIYIDEKYVHQNYKVKKSWQGPSVSGVVEKISAGKRHIIVHAGSEEGFLPNALLVFSTKYKTSRLR